MSEHEQYYTISSDGIVFHHMILESELPEFTERVKKFCNDVKVEPVIENICGLETYITTAII